MTSIYIPTLTLDVRNAIKSSLCAVIFTKKDLLTFFKESNCTVGDLKRIDPALMSKPTMVDTLFNNLSQRSDRGVRQLHTILDQLCNWSDFDSYWFEEGRLDAQKAKKKIEKLKELVGKKTSAQEVLEKRKERELREKQVKNRVEELENLRNEFYSMCKDLNNASQKRGYQLQDFIQKLFTFFNVEIIGSFRLEGEEIDGAFKFEGDNYIFEAKWQDKQTAINQLYVFAQKVESKAMYARGVFFSINGYSDEALSMLKSGRVQKTILFDSRDFIAIIEGRITLYKLLDEKVRAAQTKGEILLTADKIMTSF